MQIKFGMLLIFSIWLLDLDKREKELCYRKRQFEIEFRIAQKKKIFCAKCGNSVFAYK
jgi:hypothetical protein